MLKNIREKIRDKDDKVASDKPAIKNEAAASINDSSEKLRARAVAEHDDLDSLLQITKTDNSTLVRDAATRRYTQLTADNDASRKTLESLYQSADTRALFFSITAASNEDSLRQLSLEKAQSDDDLLIIAEKGKHHDIRMQAASQIKSLATVDKCWRSMKTRDKLVARELKSRLDHERNEKQIAETQASQIDKIISEIDKIAHGAWQPSSANRFDHFSDQWNQLGFTPPADKKARYDSLHTIADQKAKQWRSTQSAQQRRQSIVERLAELDTELNQAKAEDLASVVASSKASLKRQQNLWQELEQQKPEPAEQEANQTQRFKSQVNSLSANIKMAEVVANAQTQLSADTANQGNLKKVATSLEKLKTQTGTPAWLSAVPQLLEKTNLKINQKSAENTELRQQIHKQLASLNSAISAKRWGPAKSIHKRIAKKIGRLESNDKVSYTEKLSRLEEKINELGDWKEFASEPKLIELCEQMKKLPSLNLSPNDCANRIKELQTQWKSMGASPAQEKHWPVFKQASDTAYEPCKKFFTARREEKKNKLAARKDICTLLEKYEKETDWSDPDWRTVEKTLRTAKREWKSNQVFDRNRGKSLEDRFTKILNLIDEKLDPVYDANASEKKDLIEKVTKLGEGAINQHCINQVKSLQSAWRLSGACRQKEDRALWQEFNKATNQIFETHRGKKREEHAASFEHVRRARDIIKTLSSISSAKEPLTEKAITDLQEEYAGLAEFPERDEKKLARDYRKAMDAVDRFKQKSANDSRTRALQSMQQNADLCSQLESLAGQPWSDSEAQVNTILDEWQPTSNGENSQAAKAMEKRKESILKLLKSDKTPDYKSNEETRRLLCIELEILCDKETPPEDKSVRMQYQLEQLQQGLQSSSVSGTRAEQIEQLQIKWLTCGPADATTQSNLNSRFNQTIESVKK